MPVQYCLGVRDFDEAQGIAVFGNAFGELCLCDFSGSSAFHSEGLYSHPLRASSYGGEERLPTVSGYRALILPFIFFIS